MSYMSYVLSSFPPAVFTKKKKKQLVPLCQGERSCRTRSDDVISGYDITPCQDLTMYIFSKAVRSTIHKPSVSLITFYYLKTRSKFIDFRNKCWGMYILACGTELNHHLWGILSHLFKLWSHQCMSNSVTVVNQAVSHRFCYWSLVLTYCMTDLWHFRYVNAIKVNIFQLIYFWYIHSIKSYIQ